MDENGIKIESKYTLNFKDIKYKSYEAILLIRRMLNEFKNSDLRGHLKNIKPKSYCFNLILIVKEKK